MNRWHPFTQLFLARLREFFREPVAIFWVYGFPLLLALALAIAFRSKKPEPVQVDVAATAPEATELQKQLEAGGLQAEVRDEATCRKRVQNGQVALVIVPRSSSYDYLYDQTRPEALLARFQVDSLVQRWKAGAKQWPTSEVLQQEPGNRYIDFLMPGLMGMNLMGGGLWGVGFVLVDMRVRKLMKRLVATPMNRGDFLLSILCARMVFMLPEMLMLLGVAYWGFGVPLRGNLLTLCVVIFVGAAAFSGIGLLVACRTDKTETVSGLMNLVMLPMWLLSGTFFSSKNFPDAAQPFIQALPLTQLNDALRSVILEGVSLIDVGWRLGILALWGVVTFTLALRWFRWQ